VLPCVCNTFSPTVERWMDRRSVGFRADVNPPAIHTLSDHRGTIRNVCRPICFSDGLRSVRPGCGGSPPSFSEYADYLWGIVDARNIYQPTNLVPLRCRNSVLRGRGSGRRGWLSGQIIMRPRMTLCKVSELKPQPCFIPEGPRKASRKELPLIIHAENRRLPIKGNSQPRANFHRQIKFSFFLTAPTPFLVRVM
jgi:hypothetical protein